ncbi:ribosome recycling factor [Candidatus Nomurabacteria bacterium]|jgi:ribosome recycling factor|nr:MAG: ribosome recycling factor [Candidatus Nomurabacteria bacterium]
MAYNFSSFKDKIAKAEEWLLHEYASLHTGRASPAILDGITVESYGTMQTLKNVASIGIEDAKTLKIAPWDKSLIPEIQKAIGAANIGLSTAPDDTGVRVIFPMLTTETRERLVKVVKERLEDARITIRKEREEEQSNMKDAAMSEDEHFRAKEELQKYVDEANKKLEGLFEKKQTEVMN